LIQDQSVQKKLKTLEDQFEVINDHFVLIGDYQMEVDEIEQASYRSMANDFIACKEAIDMVQEAKIENIKKFNSDLTKEVDKLREDVIRIRNAAQNEMILSAGKFDSFF
jgi:hypothetical protein